MGFFLSLWDQVFPLLTRKNTYYAQLPHCWKWTKMIFSCYIKSLLNWWEKGVGGSENSVKTGERSIFCLQSFLKCIYKTLWPWNVHADVLKDRVLNQLKFLIWGLQRRSNSPNLCTEDCRSWKRQNMHMQISDEQK